jgi:hypothetical protein
VQALMSGNMLPLSPSHGILYSLTYQNSFVGLSAISLLSAKDDAESVREKDGCVCYFLRVSITSASHRDVSNIHRI